MPRSSDQARGALSTKRLKTWKNTTTLSAPTRMAHTHSTPLAKSFFTAAFPLLQKKRGSDDSCAASPPRANRSRGPLLLLRGPNLIQEILAILLPEGLIHRLDALLEGDLVHVGDHLDTLFLQPTDRFVLIGDIDVEEIPLGLLGCSEDLRLDILGKGIPPLLRSEERRV